MTRTTARRIIVASLLALGLAAQAAPANAEPATTESVPTMIILDASGSMLNEDAPGKRIDAAKQAVHGLVDRLPGEAKLGLQVYGTGTGSSDAEKAAGCQDVKTLVPVGPVNKSAFLSAVDGVNASGYTPIGEALRKAAAELPTEGPRAIVLVSDGIDTCAPPPPCEVAKELAAEDGLDLTVHAVGFRVDAEARTDLQCIADATGGTYADANNAEQLDQALQQKVEYAITGYEVEGIPVVGTETSDDPSIPLLAPGQYTDTLPALPDADSEVTRHYKINAPEGWTPHISIAGILPPDPAEDADAASLIWQASKTLLGGCGWNSDSEGPFPNSARPLVASRELSCDGEMVLTVSRWGSLHAGAEMQLEIVVRFEPPADASGVPAAQTLPVPDPPTRSTEVLPLTAGTSFNNAAEITPGQTYSSTVTDRDFAYFKVPMTWGQQLAYRFDATTRDGDRDTRIHMGVNLHSPMRNWITSASDDQDWYGQGGPESLPVIGGTDEPVRYTSVTYSLDGYYYLMVGVPGTQRSGEIRQNFEFTVDAVGEIEPGPIYLTDGETPSLKPSPSANSTPDPAPAPAETDRGANIVPWLVGTVVLVGAAGGAAVIVRRRRG